MKTRKEGWMEAAVAESRRIAQRMTVGTRVYYTGDMANHPAVGTITATEDGRWGFQAEITWDADEFGDQRPVSKGIGPTHFSPGPGTRFYFLDDWKAQRAAQIAEMQANMMAAVRG